MKKILITMLLLTLVLAACKSNDEPKEKKPDTPKVEVDEKEKDEEKDEDEKEEVTGTENEGEVEVEETEDENVNKPENTDDGSNNSSSEGDTNQTEKPVVDEKVEVSAEKIIMAQNNRDYATLKAYLGQNITVDENKNILKIKGTSSPYDAEFLKEIEAGSLEHRYTEKTEKDYIVGYAAFNKQEDMSYTIDLTMRMGSNGWKMINMQVNK